MMFFCSGTPFLRKRARTSPATGAARVAFFCTVYYGPSYRCGGLHAHARRPGAYHGHWGSMHIALGAYHGHWGRLHIDMMLLCAGGKGRPEGAKAWARGNAPRAMCMCPTSYKGKKAPQRAGSAQPRAEGIGCPFGTVMLRVANFLVGERKTMQRNFCYFAPASAPAL